MTLDELAQCDTDNRRRTVEQALAAERRGFAQRRAQGGRTDAIEHNIARLTEQLERMTR